MSETVQTALIVAIAPTLLATAAVISSIWNSKKLEGIHIDLNSRLTELLQATSTSERAAGKAEGIAEGRERGITERAERVAEEERVEDRVREKKQN